MDLIQRLKHFEQGGTVENPKALIREAIGEIERLRYDADHFTKQLQDALDPGAGDEWDADDVIAIVRELEAEVDSLRQRAT